MRRRDLLRMALLGAPALRAACPDDYRALVCVMMAGGNDGNNMLLPIAMAEGNPLITYSQYARVRGGLAVPLESVVRIYAGNGDQFGLHGSLKELGEMYNQRKNVAVLANVGPLAEPLTRAEYRGGKGMVPAGLYSHGGQQAEWQAMAGAAFGAVDGCEASEFPLPVWLGGGSGAALRGGGESPRMTGVTNLLRVDDGLAMVRGANTFSEAGLAQSRLLEGALDGVAPLTTAFPNTALGRQLGRAARMIQARGALGVRRQIFLAAIGGFDTHERQLTDQAAALAQLSGAVSAFYQATVEMGVSDRVVTFTASEFGRTLQACGGGTLGSDHGWGSHHLIVGDAVQGGEVYGKYPAMALDGPDDATGRGVWIPTMATDQYGAALGRWFGISEEGLAEVFPNLASFAGGVPAFLGSG